MMMNRKSKYNTNMESSNTGVTGNNTGFSFDNSRNTVSISSSQNYKSAESHEQEINKENFDHNYVQELNAERELLSREVYPHCLRLISHEINRVTLGGEDMVDLYNNKPTQIAVKVRVPVEQHPDFNFIGKIIGPKGNSLKRLQEETGCQICVCGRGSMRDKDKEELLRKEGGKYAHLNEDLHVYIQCSGHPVDVYRRMSFALHAVKCHLIPNYEDDITKNQVQELAYIKGKTAVPPPRLTTAPRPPPVTMVAPVVVPEPSFPAGPPQGPPQGLQPNFRGGMRAPGPRMISGRGMVRSRGPYMRGRGQGLGLGRGTRGQIGLDPSLTDENSGLQYGADEAAGMMPVSNCGSKRGAASSKLFKSNRIKSYDDSNAYISMDSGSANPASAYYTATAAAGRQQPGSSAAAEQAASMTQQMLSGVNEYGQQQQQQLQAESWNMGKVSGGFGGRMQSIGGLNAGLSGPYPGSMGDTGFTSQQQMASDQQEYSQAFGGDQALYQQQYMYYN